LNHINVDFGRISRYSSNICVLYGSDSIMTSLAAMGWCNAHITLAIGDCVYVCVCIS